jgi:hypothetical protein
MLDISIAYNRYKFLGFEFLTWMWYELENNPEQIRIDEFSDISVRMGNRVMIENAFHNSRETVTIQGDDAGLEEGMIALKKGGLIAEINLVVENDRQQMQFTIKGESLSVSGLKIQQENKAESTENPEEAEAFLLDRIFTCERITSWMYLIFNRFVRLRLSESWKRSVIPAMRQWILRPDEG